MFLDSRTDTLCLSKMWQDCTCIRNGFPCTDGCKCKSCDQMINVEDDYGESDKVVGFSDDGDEDEQEWIDCILIIFFL